MLRAARARFALTLARAKIYSNTGALPQPPSGEPRSPEPLCAAGYVRAISVFPKKQLSYKSFFIFPLDAIHTCPPCPQVSSALRSSFVVFICLLRSDCLVQGKCHYLFIWIHRKYILSIIKPTQLTYLKWRKLCTCSDEIY